MTTKAQFITQAKAANPKPLHRIENGVSVELTDDEYDASIEAWATMRVEQETASAAIAAKAAALESARAKLAKLGLTHDELEAFLGV